MGLTSPPLPMKLFFITVYFWLRRVSSSLLSLGFLWLQQVGATLKLWCTGFLLQWLLLLQLLGSRAQAQLLWHMGLAAPWHVRSSQTRDRTYIPDTNRQTQPLAPGKSLEYSKAMVFPVVMNGCESWTVKKAER